MIYDFQLYNLNLIYELIDSQGRVEERAFA